MYGKHAENAWRYLMPGDMGPLYWLLLVLFQVSLFIKLRENMVLLSPNLFMNVFQYYEMHINNLPPACSNSIDFNKGFVILVFEM